MAGLILRREVTGQQKGTWREAMGGHKGHLLLTLPFGQGELGHRKVLGATELNPFAPSGLSLLLGKRRSQTRTSLHFHSSP